MSLMEVQEGGEAKDKIQAWVNVRDLHCSICTEPLYSAVCLPCLHRYCEGCAFSIDKCALCRHGIDFKEEQVYDSFLQELARDNIKCVPLCRQTEALPYSEQETHIQNCVQCLRLYLGQHREKIRLFRKRSVQIAKLAARQQHMLTMRTIQDEEEFEDTEEDGDDNDL